jgi:tetratricopeptide (TPR) repeat protein
VEFAFAQLGLGGVALDQGNLFDAEHYFWKTVRAALRQGRTSVAGAAHHDLLGVVIAAGRYGDAMQHAERAVQFYPAKHPRLPNLVADIGFLWMVLHHYSTAIYLFDRVLPWFQVQSHRILLWAALARSAAAVHDRVRYERLSVKVLELVAAGNERSASSLYHLAEGACYFGQWDRSAQLGTQAFEEAQRVGNQTVIVAAGQLLERLRFRNEALEDQIPVEGGQVDRLTVMLLKKLAKQPAPGPSEAVLFPERYPAD